MIVIMFVWYIQTCITTLKETRGFDTSKIMLFYKVCLLSTAIVSMHGHLQLTAN